MSSRDGTLDGSTYHWLDDEKKGRYAACDKCMKRVFPDAPRMRLHDEKGKVREGSRGQTSSYWCVDCASKRGIHPPMPEVRGVQEGFNLE